MVQLHSLRLVSMTNKAESSPQFNFHKVLIVSSVCTAMQSARAELSTIKQCCCCSLLAMLALACNCTPGCIIPAAYFPQHVSILYFK